MGRLLAQVKRSREWGARACTRRRLCRGSLAGVSARVRGADLLTPVAAGGVRGEGDGAVNASSPPPDEGADAGRGADVRMSSGFCSEQGRPGGANSALDGGDRTLDGGSVGVRGCGRSGGGCKAS